MAVGAGAGPGDPQGPVGGGGAPGVPGGPGSRDPLVGETGVERRPLDRGIADPGPLGLAGFAMTTFVLSMINAKLVNAGDGSVLGLALFYGGAAQLLAGMWEFKTGNTFGAVAFTSYGAFWMSFWAINQFYSDKVTTAGIGLYLAAWAIFTAYMFVASMRTTAAISAVFLLLTITYALLALGNADESNNIVKVGGYFGLATALAAAYASFAAVTNSTFGKTVLPVIPLKRD